jgi:hypothetical protein
MDVAYNLVHPHETSNIATFRCLLLDMVGPMFLNALVNACGVTETPASPRVRLTNGIARVAAPALVSFTAITRATITFRALLVQFVNVVTELSDL